MVIWNRRGSPIVNTWKASVWAECNVRTEWVPEYFCCSCWERTWVLAEHCVSLGKLDIIHQCMTGCSLHYPEEKNHAILGNLKYIIMTWKKKAPETYQTGCHKEGPAQERFFLFSFFKKYIFDLEIYRNIPGRPAAGRPGLGRPAAGR